MKQKIFFLFPINIFCHLRYFFTFLEAKYFSIEQNRNFLYNSAIVKSMSSMFGYTIFKIVSMEVNFSYYQHELRIFQHLTIREKGWPDLKGLFLLKFKMSRYLGPLEGRLCPVWQYSLFLTLCDQTDVFVVFRSWLPEYSCYKPLYKILRMLLSSFKTPERKVPSTEQSLYLKQRLGSIFAPEFDQLINFWLKYFTNDIL